MAQEIITLASEETSQQILTISKQIKTLDEEIREIVEKIKGGEIVGADWGGKACETVRFSESDMNGKRFIHIRGKGRILGYRLTGQGSFLIRTLDGAEVGTSTNYISLPASFSEEFMIYYYPTTTSTTVVLVVQWQYEKGTITVEDT